MNKTLILALAGVALLSTALFFTFNHKTSPHHVNDSLMQQWTQFKQTYNKKYSDPDFEAYRIQVFASNLNKIKGDSTMGVTQFMDLTSNEFKQSYLTLKVKNVQPETVYTPTASYIDWTDSQKVTDVKDQGQCGSCWAFSTTGSLESALIIAGKNPRSVDLSEQELVDCSASYGNQGCNGGLMDQGFQYIIDNGLSSNSDYPYTATDGKCKNTKKFTKVHASKFTDIPAGNCDSLKSALATQPVSIAVDANNWQFYTSGVFNNCQDSLDHGVLLVGYISKNNVNAWKVKNSWANSWGDSGYIYLADGNTCGLCNVASYPSV